MRFPPNEISKSEAIEGDFPPSARLKVRPNWSGPITWAWLLLVSLASSALLVQLFHRPSSFHEAMALRGTLLFLSILGVVGPLLLANGIRRSARSERTGANLYAVIARILAVLVAAEAAIMLVLHVFGELPLWLAVMIDSTSLALFSGPIIYLWIILPLDRELGLKIATAEELSATLAASESRLRAILDTAPDSIITIDSRGLIQTFNQAAERLFGYAAAEVIGQNVTLLMGRPYREEHDGYLARYLKTGERRLIGKNPGLEVPARRQDGTEIFIGLHISEIIIGGERMFIGILRDLTERRRAEAEQLRLAKAFNATADGIVLADVEGKILKVNPAFTRITGYAAEKAIGRTPRILKSGVHPPEFYKTMWKTIASGHAWSGKLVDRRKDGSLYHASLVISPVIDDEGILSGYVGAQRDVTEDIERQEALQRHAAEIEKANEALREAEAQAQAASRAKSQFLANMSHELRTPMNGVIGMIDLLADSVLDEDQRELAETANRSAKALLNVINDILDFSKIEAGKLVLDTIDFDLRSVVEDVGMLLAGEAKAKGLELITDLPPDVPAALRGDPGRLRQILINLTGNAIKFTGRGEVMVRVSRVHGEAEEALLRFEVIDTGIGIPPEARARLFQSFSQIDGSTTRQHGGTGLGLAISRRLVLLMKGEIGVDSEVGRGSTFYFTARFPLQAGSAAGSPPPANLLQDLNILIVDGHAIQRQVLRRQLSGWGARCQEAGDGPAALDLLKRGIQDGDPFDLIVLDRRARGPDGQELSKSMSSDPRLGAIPVILMIPFGQGFQEEAESGSPIAACLAKPVRQSQLLECLEKALKKSGRASGWLLASSLSASLDVKASTALTPRPLDREGRILLAEDNPVNQKVAARMLKRLGYQADIVASGQEVLEAISRKDYVLILMDCQMPELDGFEATVKIRELEARIMNGELPAPPGPAFHRRRGAPGRLPIIALTANAMQGDRERCLQAGMDDYLAKPLDLIGLQAVLEKWIPA